MCGIAGFVNLNGRPFNGSTDRVVLDRMGDAMHHRGPDDTARVAWQNIGMIFKRLSIVDPQTGAQPFHVAEGRITAFINGEIYNHRDIRRNLGSRHQLRTHSDCEVIPYLYCERGLDLFAAVNGMFGVALLDRERQTLLLARDRLGVKPMFYCVANETFVFATELKALFAHPEVPRRFDWQAAVTRTYNAEGCPPELASGFLGIERVPAASIVCLSLPDGRLQTHRYWDLPVRQAHDERERAADSYVEEYRALLEDSVQLRLMADVDCGIFLSGGIDSAAITAIAAKSKRLPTFSVMHQSTLEDAKAAFVVAKHLDVPNHQVLFDSATESFTAADWRRVLWTCELCDITAEQLFKYFLHGFARRRYPNLKVILLGQGSDEFNGGYMSTILAGKGPYAAEDWENMGAALRHMDAVRRANMLGMAGPSFDLVARGIIGEDFIDSMGASRPKRTTWDLYVDHYRSNLDNHLWHEDRTASAHAIEGRFPFLDYRVVELLAAIPETHHGALFTDKRILRDAVRDLLPEQIVDRRKGAFFYGRKQHHAFRLVYGILMSNRGELIEQAIEGSALSNGPINPDEFRKFAVDVGNDPDYRGLNSLLVLVNMGVLADLAGSWRLPVPSAEASTVAEIRIDGWREWQSSEEAKRLLAVNEPAPEMVVKFAPGVSLIEIKRSSVGGPRKGEFHVMISGKGSRPLASPSWLEFLTLVDGRRTLAEILAYQNFNELRVWKQLRGAVDEGVLVFEPQPASPGVRLPLVHDIAPVSGEVEGGPARRTKFSIA